MKLLYTGSPTCNPATLKRLLIIADEIAFMDRPSVSFGGSNLGGGKQWGTIETQSYYRNYIHLFENTPVRISAHMPPFGFEGRELYSEYVQADLDNLEFRRIFLKGLSTNKLFAEKFIPKGEQMIALLTRDSELAVAHLGHVGLEFEEKPFRMDTLDGRRDWLRMNLATVSIVLTGAMIVSDQIGFPPVTDDPFLAQLLASRLSNQAYLGDTTPATSWLGLEIARAVIPDEALLKLSIDDILEYREKAKDAYQAWSVEITRFANKADLTSLQEFSTDLPKLIATEMAPRLIEYRNEMKAITDRLFGDLIKTVAKYELPTLTLAYFANISVSQAITAFVAALSPAVPALVNFWQEKRKAKRQHWMSYLIDLVE